MFLGLALRWKNSEARYEKNRYPLKYIDVGRLVCMTALYFLNYFLFFLTGLNFKARENQKLIVPVKPGLFFSLNTSIFLNSLE